MNCHHSSSLRMGRRPKRERCRSGAAEVPRSPQSRNECDGTKTPSLSPAADEPQKHSQPPIANDCLGPSNSMQSVSSLDDFVTTNTGASNAEMNSLLLSDFPFTLGMASSWDGCNAPVEIARYTPHRDAEGFGVSVSTHGSKARNSPNHFPTAAEDGNLDGTDADSVMNWNMDSIEDCSRPGRWEDSQLSPPVESQTEAANPIQNLAELNTWLQELVEISGQIDSWVSCEAEAAKSRNGEHVASESKLINNVLRAGQTLLDIIRMFQPPSSIRCLGCQKTSSASEQSDRNAEHLRPNTQTLLSMISSYVQLLRLCSNFFGHVSDALSIHSVGGSHCIGLGHFSLLADQPLKGFPVRLTIELQLLVSIEIIISLLDSIERALGYTSRASVHSEDHPRPIVPLRKGHGTDHLSRPECNACSTKTTSENMTSSGDFDDNVGLLERYRSHELLATILKHEDIESQDNGKRSIGRLRDDIERVKSMI